MFDCGTTGYIFLVGLLPVDALRWLDAFLLLKLGTSFLTNCDVHVRELVRLAEPGGHPADLSLCGVAPSLPCWH